MKRLTFLRRATAILIAAIAAANAGLAQFNWNQGIKGLHDPTMAGCGVSSTGTYAPLYSQLISYAGPSNASSKHAIYNILIDSIFPQTAPTGTDKFTYNYGGSSYFFSNAAINNLDTDIKNLTAAGMNVTAVLLLHNLASPPLYYTSTPVPTVVVGGQTVGMIYGFNASTSSGLNAFKAVVDFLVHRYSVSSANGLVSGYIVGNEIQNSDTSYNVNPAGTGQSPVATVAADYALAIAAVWDVIQAENTSVRVYISMDRHWTASGTGGYGGFAFLNTFIAEPRMTAVGWDVAFHPYCQSIGQAPWLPNDATQSLTTQAISFNNLEVLYYFLNQPGPSYTPANYPISAVNYRLPNGSLRRIILSEQGTDSSGGQSLQAAAYAYDYIRASRLPGVDAFQWATLLDESYFAPGGNPSWYYTGLLNSSLATKSIWNVFENADSASWTNSFAPYLAQIPTTIAKGWNDLNPYVTAPVAGPVQFTNQSFRGPVAPNQTMIGGFVIVGGTMNVLVRGDGYTLSNFGITNYLSNPTISIYNSSNMLVGSNTKWTMGNATSQIFSQVGAFQLSTPTPTAWDSATVLYNLAPGTYTVDVNTAGGNSGISLFEVYNAGVVSGSPTLSNFSARGQINTGSGNGIESFTITGTGTKALLIRADGPGLAQFGVTGYLTNPTITITNTSSNLVVAQNTVWGTSMNSYDTLSYGAATGAFGLPSGSADSALFVRLYPGQYSVSVSGVGGGTGNCLIEMYDAGQ